MTKPEVVFARFVELNPVQDLEMLQRGGSSIDELIETIRDEPRPDRVKATRAKPRGGWLVAVASFLVVISLGVALNWDRGASEPEPDVALDAIEVVRRDAVSKTEQWLDAVNRSDIATVMALSGPSASDLDDRRVHEWVAGFASNGMPTRVIACDVVEATAEAATVDCQVRLTDPVAVELGVSELVAPFTYADGLITWQPYKGNDISQVNTAYSSYLRQYHQTDYEAVCSPQAYDPGSVIQDRLLALTGPCAVLAAPLADTVAQWIRDDRPAPAG